MNLNATLFAQCVVFFVLAWFTMRFVWPLVKALDERATKIAEGLNAAEKGKHDLQLAEQRAADKLREAKAQAAEILALAEKRAGQLVEEAKNAAKAEGERQLAAAQAEITQLVSQAKEDLRLQVAGLAVAGAEKILRREIDAKAHAELLETLKAEL